MNSAIEGTDIAVAVAVLVVEASMQETEAKQIRSIAERETDDRRASHQVGIASLREAKAAGLRRVVALLNAAPSSVQALPVDTPSGGWQIEDVRACLAAAAKAGPFPIGSDLSALKWAVSKIESLEREVSTLRAALAEAREREDGCRNCRSARRLRESERHTRALIEKPAGASSLSSTTTPSTENPT